MPMINNDDDDDDWLSRQIDESLLSGNACAYDDWPALCVMHKAWNTKWDGQMIDNGNVERRFA